MANVTLAHHWMLSMRGGEKVLQQLGYIFPQAPILTLISRPKWLSADLQKHRIQSSPLQWLPGAARQYRSLMPLYPTAVGCLRVPKDTDFLFTSDASVIKGLKTEADIPHVCYCHSPPRYLWDEQSSYLRRTNSVGVFGRTV